MSDVVNTGVTYVYDGTFDGLLCAIFEAFARREEPAAIYPEQEPQFTLAPAREILSDTEKSRRVMRGIKAKLGDEAAELVRDAYFTCLPEKELTLLRFLRRAFPVGRIFMKRLSDEYLCALNAAVHHMAHEAHLLTGFLRFSESVETTPNGTIRLLTAKIGPKNYVLPRLAAHFCDRYIDESFVIYDETHQSALFYANHRRRIVPLDYWEAPDASAEETMYRSLWKRFYDTIAIEGRTNVKLRRNNLPKRYWAYMSEMAGEK